MINLLPVENKKNIWRDYHCRHSIAVSLSILFLLLTGIILLLAFYFSSILGYQPRASAIVEKGEKERKNYEQNLEKLRSNLKLLAGPDDVFSVAEVFKRITQMKENGIWLNAFRSSVNPEGKTVLKLQISASNRKIASSFIAKLRQVEGVKEVTAPILTSDKKFTTNVDLVLGDK